MDISPGEVARIVAMVLPVLHIAKRVVILCWIFLHLAEWNMKSIPTFGEARQIWFLRFAASVTATGQVPYKDFTFPASAVSSNGRWIILRTCTVRCPGPD